MPGLGKRQSDNFSAQIASISLVALQYNVLSVVKRFTAYETIGGLFRAVNQDSLEITISERIWGTFLELVAATTRVFNITDEEVLEAALTNLMSLLIYANYIDIKWRVENSRNLNLIKCFWHFIIKVILIFFCF